MADTELTTVETLPEEDAFFAGLPVEAMERLSPAKRRMINLYLTGTFDKRKIAALIGVSEPTIRAWLREPLVQAVVSEITKQEFEVIDAELKALRYEAVQTMQELLHSDMDNVRYSAAKDILDRGGHRPAQSIKVDKTVTTIEQQLNNLAEFAISDDEVIDTDFSEIVGEEDDD